MGKLFMQQFIKLRPSVFDLPTDNSNCDSQFDEKKRNHQEI